MPFQPPLASLITQSQTVASSAGAASSLTIASVTGELRGLDSIDVSFSDLTVAGNVTITIGSTVVWKKYFTGEYAKEFKNSLVIPAGQACIVNLSAGGGSVIGQINAVQHPANFGTRAIAAYKHRQVPTH